MTIENARLGAQIIERPEYTLHLRTSPVRLSSKTDEPEVIEDITLVAKGWRRNKVYQGGADIGRFTVYGDHEFLEEVYDSYLGKDILETFGGNKTWNGRVIKVDFVWGTVGRSKDLTKMFNVITSFIEGELIDRRLQERNEASIAWYGERHLLLDVDTNTTWETRDMLQYKIRLVGWPPEEASSNVRRPDQPGYVRVYVAGYKQSLNDKLVRTRTIQYWDQIPTVIETVVDQSEWITMLRTATNNTRVTDDIEDIHGWDLISDMLKITDQNKNQYRGYIDEDRYFNYIVEDFNPRYYIREGLVYADALGKVLIAPWNIEPGIFRDLDSPVSGEERTGIFQDRRDFFVEDISVDWRGTLSLKPSADVGEYVVLFRSELWKMVKESFEGWIDKFEEIQAEFEEFAGMEGGGEEP